MLLILLVATLLAHNIHIMFAFNYLRILEAGTPVPNARRGYSCQQEIFAGNHLRLSSILVHEDF
jgi:hypothetical protein